MIESWFKQDLKKPVNVQVIKGNVFSQDSLANLIGVEVFDDGEAATLVGTVSANVIREDGSTVAVTGTREDNKCYVVLPSAAYAYPGSISVAIKLTNDTEITTLLAVVGTVYRSNTDTVIDPGTIIENIQNLIDDISDAVATIPVSYTALMADIAPTYSDEATYTVGDYAWYDGDLKRCIVPITTAETYDSTHWTNAVIGKDISNIKNVLNGVQNTLSNSEDIDFSTAGTRTGFVNTSNKWSANNAYGSYFFDVTGLKKIIVTADSNDALISLLASKTLTNQRVPTFCTGIDGNIVVSPGTTQAVDVPDDCIYVLVRKTNGTLDYTPASMSFMYYKNIADAEIIGESITELQGEITDINGILYGTREIISGNATPAIEGQTGGCQANVGSVIAFSDSSSYHYLYYDVDSDDDISFTVTTQESTSAYYPYYIHFVDSGNVVLSAYGETVESNQMVTFTDVPVPQGAVKMYVTTFGLAGNISATKKYYGQDTTGVVARVETLEQEVEDIDEEIADIPEIREDVEALQVAVGSVESEEVTVTFPAADVVTGGVKGETGNSFTRTTTSGYQNVTVPVDADAQKYTLTTKQSTSSNYPHYGWFVDGNGVVLSTIGTVASSAGIYTYSNIEIPTGAVNLIVLSEGLIANVSIKKTAMRSLSDHLQDVDKFLDKRGYANNPYADTQKDNGRIAVFGHNYEKKYLNFVFITDTHFGGTRYPEYEARNNIRAFVDMANERWADFAAHGGDIITDYGLSRNDALSWFDDTIGIFGDIQIPLFVAKGNHETNNAYYQKVTDTSNLDWEHNTYYVRSDISFAAITQSQWDGVQDLYVENLAPERIPDNQFTMLAQLGFSGEVVRNSVDPMGGYFFKDFDREKIRVIVLNEYQVQGTTFKNMTAEQKIWLGGTALDFSNKSGWAAMIISHSQNVNADVTSLINGFKNGTSVTVGGNTYDFSQQGARPFIMYLHGHEHLDTHVTTDGYNNIGVICGYVPRASVGTAEELGFSVFTIDTDDRKIYETRIGRGSNRQFTY